MREEQISRRMNQELCFGLNLKFQLDIIIRSLDIRVCGLWK